MPPITAAVTEENISMFEPLMESTVTSIELLLQLDSIVKPGILQEQFLQLFAKCRACRNVMTRRITAWHECEAKDLRRVSLADVIDLTELEEI
jgi:hypothetical protein